MASISVEDAVEQLHQMFGDYDKSALAAVLEAHGGHVERTVEHLLSGTADVPSAGGGSGGGDGGGAPAGTDYDAALALQLSREWTDQPRVMPPPPRIPAGIPTPYGRGTTGAESGGGGGGGYEGAFGDGGSGAGSGAAASNTSAQSGSTARRGRRVSLPEEFLRVPGWNGGVEVSSDPQLTADARLAMALQNEDFQRELQSHPELAHLGRGGFGNRYRERTPGGGAVPAGPSIKEQLAGIGNDVRRKMDELAIRWKMKEPGRAEDTTEYSSVPLMSTAGDDIDDQAEVVHFAQDSATRRSYSGGNAAFNSGAAGASSSASGGGLFRADSAGEEQLADPRRSKKDR